jgi:hypothetical protein
MLIILTISFAGCATESGYYDPGRSAAAGALGGAATGAAMGAIIGAATGSPGKGAAIGAAAGAVAGGVGGAIYAAHMNRRTQEAAMAAQQYNYSPNQGNFVDIGQATAVPGAVRPGQEVRFNMVYTVLTPDNAPVAVTIIREVRKDGMLVGQPQQATATNTNGTYEDSLGYRLPPGSPPGLYTVSFRIMSAAGNAEKFASFNVM